MSPNVLRTKAEVLTMAHRPCLAWPLLTFLASLSLLPPVPTLLQPHWPSCWPGTPQPQGFCTYCFLCPHRYACLLSLLLSAFCSSVTYAGWLSSSPLFQTASTPHQYLSPTPDILHLWIASTYLIVLFSLLECKLQELWGSGLDPFPRLLYPQQLARGWYTVDTKQGFVGGTNR